MGEKISFIDLFGTELKLEDEYAREMLADETAARAEDVAVLEARMDTFTALPNGSTAGDAELMDIRVGADGTTYANAGDAVRGQIGELHTVVDELSKLTIENVFDENSVIEHSYITVNGLQTSPTYSGWFTSDYIDVSDTKLQSNIPVYSIVIYNSDNTVDRTHGYNGLNTPATLPFVLPETASKIRISGKMVDFGQDIMMNFGEALFPYVEYGGVVLSPDALERSLKENHKKAKLNSETTEETYLSSCRQALKKNVVVSFTANFTDFTSLLIGFTTTDNYASGYRDYIEITETSFILHRKNLDNITWEHGLTIKDYVSVIITFDFSMNFVAKVTTNGGEYMRSNYFYLGDTYYPFAIITGENIANKKLSFSCKDLRKNIIIFGDSYISNASSRWVYYFTDVERDNLCINGYAGESSLSAKNDFDTLVKLGSPKYIVWCLGMNDEGDESDNEPSETWLTTIEYVLKVCADNNITPILTTIPSVPTINNRAKSDWVRNSGYAYIDFASAVNADDLGGWYDGMLSNDGVHPTDDGAKALFTKAITDFPELLVNN